jgi:4-hydroxybenzoate polyprenyltransferase
MFRRENLALIVVHESSALRLLTLEITAKRASMISPLSAHIKALRPHQWVKNAFVLMPLIFAAKLNDPSALTSALWAFFAFSLSASSIYLLNDTLDYERDQAHPKKRLRPIASGQVKRPVALLLSALCLGGAMSVAWGINTATLSALAAYVVMNTGYSLGLKHLFLIDLFMIAIGFILRVSVGAFAINVSLSPWLLLCTLFIALFLGLCKRRHERVSLGEEAAAHRSILAHYSVPFLDQLILITTAATIMCYALYTIDPWVCARLGTNALLLTIPLVLLGIFRYLALVYQGGEGGSPTQVVLKDRGIQVIVVLYLALSVGLIQSKLHLALTPSALPASATAPVASAEPQAPASPLAHLPCDVTREAGALKHPELDGGDHPFEEQEVNLDGDARPDLIVGLGGCGNRGDCRFAVLRACNNNRYALAWGPDYTQSLEVSQHTPPTLTTISSSGGGAACNYPVQTTHSFVKGAWSKEVCTGKGGVWDAESCGERPEACTELKGASKGSRPHTP